MIDLGGRHRRCLRVKLRQPQEGGEQYQDRYANYVQTNYD